MIDRGFAAEQVRRLTGLEYFSADPAAVRELITVLVLSDSEALATATVDDWIANNKKRPTPADLRVFVSKHNQQSSARVEVIGRQVSFDDWRAAGKAKDWDVFLDWVVNGPVEMP